MNIEIDIYGTIGPVTLKMGYKLNSILIRKNASLELKVWSETLLLDVFRTTNEWTDGKN